MPRAAVLVLGDVGRSPRMQYHSLSLAEQGYDVTLVGYDGEKCVEKVEQHPRIEKCLFSPFKTNLSRKFFIFYAPFKVVYQILQLFFVLMFSIAQPDVLLVQNPPSIPTLMVVSIVAMLRGFKTCIDWHNLGFTVLAETMGEAHVFVKLSRWYEKMWAGANAHFCVTKSMKGWLKKEFGVNATVLYDKPPEFFRPTSPDEAHQLCARLPELQTVMSSFGEEGSADMTLFTERDPKSEKVMSCTSWTPDEDFGILLDAILQVEERGAIETRVVLAITGKGPQKAMYMAKIAELEAEENADLGVCLHTSTSGLDLPMKVLDMFGSGVPVCAVGFDCLDELVKHGSNGMVFRDSVQLSTQLEDLLQGFPNECSQLHHLRDGVGRFERWADNWNAHAAPVFKGLLGDPLKSE